VPRSCAARATSRVHAPRRARRSPTCCRG
jgi:hypothetical protein